MDPAGQDEDETAPQTASPDKIVVGHSVRKKLVFGIALHMAEGQTPLCEQGAIVDFKTGLAIISNYGLDMIS